MLNPTSQFLHQDIDGVGADLAEIGEHLASDLRVMETSKLSIILRYFNTLRDAYERMDEQRKRIFAQIEHLSRTVIPERMAEEGVTTMTLDGFRYTVGTRSSTSILDKESGYGWLIINGHGDIIQQTVNASTLAAFARRYLEDTGKDLPEFFKTTSMKFTSVTKT